MYDEIKVPAFHLLMQSKTLQDYFEPVLSWNPKGFPYREKLTKMIKDKVESLYGGSTAQKIEEKLTRNFIAMTGNHMGFPRDRDTLNEPSGRSIQDMSTQGSLVMASMDNICLEFLTSRTPLSNSESPRYLQLSSDGTWYTVVPKKYKDYPVMFLPAISEHDCMQLENELPRNNDSRAILDIFRSNKTIVDQCALTYAFFANKALHGMAQKVTIDSENLCIEFIADLLCDKESLIHRALSKDPEKFIKYFSGLGIGWKENGSPFSSVITTDKGLKKIQDDYFGTLDPCILANKLRNRDIIPKGILKFWVMMAEAGMLPIGGMFQSTYCTDLRNRLVNFCDDLQELKTMPTEIAAVSVIFAIKPDGTYWHNSDFWEKHFDFKRIPSMSGECAALASFLKLYEFMTAKPIPKDEYDVIMDKLKKENFLCA